MPRRARRLTLAVLVPALLAGCTAGPSTRPAVVENDGPPPRQHDTGRTTAPLPELEKPQASALDWADCGGQTRQRLADAGGTGAPGDTASVDYACTNVTTTLDSPDMPARGLTRVSLLKAGSGPIPLVVVNDIDGEPGTLHAARLANTLPDELLRRFSLIGVDRRGTGASDPARCIPGDVRSELLGHDPDADLEPLLDAARTAGQQCAINLEDEKGAYDSWRTAGDLEEIRQALGVGHLNAIGHGEGSRVVAIYGARFPEQLGRVVLDGMPDPSDDAAGVLGDVAAGAEATLDALGGSARTDVTELVARSRTDPIPAADRPLGPANVLRAVLAGLAEPDRWGELTDAIGAAKGGDGAPLARFLEPQLDETAYSAPLLDGVLATRCNDTAARLPADELAKTTERLGRQHPVFGAVLAQRLVWCSPWASRSEAPPPIGTTGEPPMMVVSTATDPVTPEQGTIRAAEQIPSAVRVAWQGTGHGGLGSPCVARAATGFLVDGTVPRDGTLCPA